MLPILALLALWAPIPEAPASAILARQDAQELVLDQLEKALLGGDPERLIRALGRSARIRDLRVSRASTLALNNKNVRVRAAALEALRFNPHPRALPTLHFLFKNKSKGKRDFTNEDVLMPLLLRATGQHGDSSSLPLIAMGGFYDLPGPVVRARILALGHIRHKGSVTALMQAMENMGTTERMLHMDEFRLALTHLIDEDHGLSPGGWIRWWQKNKNKFRLRRADDKVTGALQLEWEAYWSQPAQLPPKRTKPPAPRPKKPGAGRRQNRGGPIEAGAKKPKPREEAREQPEQESKKAKTEGEPEEGTDEPEKNEQQDEDGQPIEGEGGAGSATIG